MYPLRADHAAEWLTAMAEAGGRTAATIAQYKSALHTHFACSQPFTDHGANPLSHPRLKRLLTGVEKSKAAPERGEHSTYKACSPLTFDLVRQLRAVHSETDRREVMMYAAIAVGTAACLRPSELLGSSTYPERALTAAQVVFFAHASTDAPVLPATTAATPTRCMVLLHTSKTRLHGEERVVGAAEAVQALWHWCILSGAQGRTTLFQLDGHRLTTNSLIGHLRRKLGLIGQGHLYVTGKCFRRGGASTLSALGADAEDITAAGGWAKGSVVWQTYANAPEVQRARINAQMQRAISLSTAAAAAASHWTTPAALGGK